MLVLPQRVEVKWTNSTKKYYEEKGYIWTGNGDMFEVDVLDLKINSEQLVQVQCDYCHETYFRKYVGYNRTKEKTKTGKDFCAKCKSIATTEAKTIYNYEDAASLFLKSKLKVLTVESQYGNANTSLEYECLKCGHHGNKSLTSLIEGTKCFKCHVNSKIGNSGKYRINDVRQIFKDNSCILLSEEYINMNQKLKFICDCGEEDEITIKSFLNGARCRSCTKKKIGDSQRTSIQIIANIFSSDGYEVLSESYDYADQKIRYRCLDGHEDEMTFTKFKGGKRCPSCFRLRVAKQYKLDMKEVSSRFEEKGFTLLSTDYHNSYQKLDFICKCGNIHKTTLANLRHIDGCPKCQVVSKGEIKIAEYLDNNNINYDTQFTFEDCKNINVLNFDFAILNKDNNLMLLIEYDGIQHFKPIEHWGGEENLSYIQQNDQIKNKYCIKNNIPLIRIPYWENESLHNITEEIVKIIHENNAHLLQESSLLGSFLISKEVK